MVAWGIAVCVVVSGSLMPAIWMRHLPSVAVPDNDKAAHFLAYLLLAMLPVGGFDVLRVGVLLALSMIPLGVMLEIFQRLVPSRSFEPADMVANVLGVLTGVILGMWVRWFRRAVVAEAD